VPSSQLPGPCRPRGPGGLYPSETALAAPFLLDRGVPARPFDTLAADDKEAVLGIMNRRNAVLGWSVWTLGKKVAKRKAKAAVPGTGEHAGLNKSAIATIAATVGGVLFFWRKKSGDSTAA